jgi:hypothetical protein
MNCTRQSALSAPVGVRAGAAGWATVVTPTGCPPRAPSESGP